jgi:hypothetical protein
VTYSQIPSVYMLFLVFHKFHCNHTAASPVCAAQFSSMCSKISFKAAAASFLGVPSP